MVHLIADMKICGEASDEKDLAGLFMNDTFGATTLTTVGGDGFKQLETLWKITSHVPASCFAV